MNKKSYTVYKLTSKDGRVYIGCTSNIKQRWESGRSYRSSPRIYDEILKNGFNSFKKEIICTGLDRESGWKKEEELISYYDSTNPEKGFNVNPSVHFIAEEVKLKISEKEKGRIPYWSIGRNQSEEERRKRSLSLKGKVKGRYIGAKSPRARKVCQYNKNFELIKTYDCISDVQRELGYDYTSIVKACCDPSRTIGGFIWRYENDSPRNYIHPQKKSKMIDQLDMNGNFIRSWNSALEIERELGIFRGSIYIVCNKGRLKSTGGYKWRFHDV